MTVHQLTSGVALFAGDNRDVLRLWPDNSIDACVTDPPYAFTSIVKRFANSPRSERTENTENPYGRTGRGFMGKEWDTGEVAFSVEFWAEVLRVLKPGGHVVAFGSSRGYHRLACAIEDAGFEIRDSLMWVYGTGFPKSQDVARFIDRELGHESVAGAAKVYAGGHVQNTSHDKLAPPIGTFARSQDERREFEYVTERARDYAGFGTALKPAFEPIVLARKPLSEKTVAANVLRWGTGALNIGACKVGTETLPAQRAGQAQLGTFERHDMVTPEREGRWPANVVLSYPEDSFTVRANIDSTQRVELEQWFAENAEHAMPFVP